MHYSTATRLPSAEYPKVRHANYALAVLLLAYILSFIDRNIMAVLVGPIREQFGISDVQFSLLHGTAFSLFYIFLGLPVGWLADRISRKRIIVLGVLFWSVMTCLCGVANSFLILFLVRIGVGVGEATLSPATYSLLGDLFPPERLRWATAIFVMGITLGTGLSYSVGGWVYGRFSALDISALPLLQTMNPWQLTFIAVGAPGLLVVALLFAVIEPPRRVAKNQSGAPIPLVETLRYFRRHWQAYGSLVFAVCMMSVIGYGTMAWFPEFLIRTHALDRAVASNKLGVIFLVAGTAGSLAGAAMATWLQRRGYEDANPRWVMLVAIALIIPAVWAPRAQSLDVTLLLTWCIIFLHYTHFGVAMAALQLITPNRMRAVTSALMLFMTNLFGLTLGATIVAVVTDYVFGNSQALRYSLSWVAAITYPLAAISMAAGLKYYRAALLPN